MAEKKTKKRAEAAATTGEFELPDDYQPDNGDWTGSQPVKKAKHFWPSAKRLLGLLAPEKWLFSLVVLLVVASVVLTVIAPKILGQAMDVIFNGILGKQLPAGVPIEQIIAGLAPRATRSSPMCSQARMWCPARASISVC